jgi:hypothetical protein
MSGFNELERGFEEKFAREGEESFRAEARANKLLGLWVADQMGISGDDDVVQQAMADLADKDLGTTEADIRAELQRCRDQVDADSA